ncbi:MAG: hypothetical protein ABW212_19585 [Pseudonocardia sediminis]
MSRPGERAAVVIDPRRVPSPPLAELVVEVDGEGPDDRSGDRPNDRPNDRSDDRGEDDHRHRAGPGPACDDRPVSTAGPVS